MQRVAINDGSVDNILDRANCFTIKYPVTVNANSEDVTVNNEAELNDVEAMFSIVMMMTQMPSQFNFRSLS